MIMVLHFASMCFVGRMKHLDLKGHRLIWLIDSGSEMIHNG